MFNLIKYEIKGYYQKIIGAWIAIAITYAFLFYQVGKWDKNGLAILGFLVTFTSIIVVLVWNVKIITRELYGDSGYLLLTLPHSGYTILGAKIIAAIIQMLLVGAVSIVLCLELFYLCKIFDLLKGINITTEFTTVAIVSQVIEYLELIIFIYFVAVVGRVAIVNRKGGKAMSFVMFIILQVVISSILKIISEILPATFKINLFSIEPNQVILTNSSGSYVSGLWGVHDSILFINVAGTAFLAITMIGLFIATSYLIENKMDL